MNAATAPITPAFAEVTVGERRWERFTAVLGIDARWLVLHTDPTFFAITKRLHNRLHGAAGDGGPR